MSDFERLYNFDSDGDGIADAYGETHDTDGDGVVVLAIHPENLILRQRHGFYQFSVVIDLRLGGRLGIGQK